MLELQMAPALCVSIGGATVQELMLLKNVNNKKCALELIFFNEKKKLRKIRINFDIEN